MVKSLDDLLRFLLEEIALCGEQGAGASDVFAFIQEFYDEKPVASVDATVQLQAENTRAGLSTDLAGNIYNNTTTEQSITHNPDTVIRIEHQRIDRSFEEKVWSWLIAHHDIRICQDIVEKDPRPVSGEGDVRKEHGLAPGQSNRGTPVRENLSGDLSPGRVIDGSCPETILEVGARTESSPTTTGNRTLRLRVSEERIWRALTGHGVDWTRCPRLEFACLSAIAAQRQRGILQPQLIRVTGQDKRSLPRRTDTLAKKGYIQKTMNFMKGQRTSHLLLRKYANKEVPYLPSTAGESNKQDHDKAAAGQGAWTGESLETGALMRSMFGELKQHGIMTQADLKWKLGLETPSWQLNVFKRLVRKLELIGCIRRVKARADEAGGGRIHACIKFIHEPENQDWRLKWDLSLPEGLALLNPPETEVEVDAESEDNTDEQAQSVQSAICYANRGSERQQSKDHLHELGRVIPQWMPGKPMANLLFNLVDATGTEGISTMVVTRGLFCYRDEPCADIMKLLKARSMGAFYQRPLEVTLDRLTQHVNESQPPHLRHLALIRDTAQHQKTCHYQYFSHDNFQQLVDRGKASWNSVVASANDTKKRASKGAKSPRDIVTYDEYGFANLPDSRFVRQDGCATLSDSLLATKAKDLSYTARDPLICKTDQGTYDIDWGYEGVGRAPKYIRQGEQSRQYKKTQKPETPPKPRGRPRKYAKGEEPYLAAKRRKLARMEEQNAAGSANDTAEQHALQNQTPLGDRERDVRTEEPNPEELFREINLPPHGLQANLMGLAQHERVSPSPQTTPSGKYNDRRMMSKGFVEIQTPNTTTSLRDLLGPNEAVPEVSISEPQSNRAALDNTVQDLAKGTNPENEKLGGAPHDVCRSNAVKTGLKEGKSLVLIDPPGSKPPRTKRGRPPKSMIVVFKFEGLRTLEWFKPPPPTIPSHQSSKNSMRMNDILANHPVLGLHAANPTSDLPTNDSNNPVPSGSLPKKSKRPRGNSHNETSKKRRRLQEACPTGVLEQSNLQIGLDSSQNKSTTNQRSDARIVNEHDPEGTGDLGFHGNTLGPASIEQVSDDREGPADANGLSQNRTVAIHERGSLNFKRKQIILDLVDKLGGVFPGDRELWYPFSSIWMKENKGSGRPDIRTLVAAQKALVDSGQLKTFKFCFTNSKGLRSEKKILARMDVHASSPLVKELEQKMRDADYDFYIPPEAGLSTEERRRLDQANSNASRYGSIPRVKIAEDTTSKVMLLRDPIAHETDPQRSEKRRRVEEKRRMRDEHRQLKEERRLHKRWEKANKALFKLSISEQKEAAKKIRRIAESRSKTDTGPPRVARLYGLQRSGLSRRIAPAQVASQPDFPPLPTQARTPADLHLSTNPASPVSLISLLYKHERTRLNAPEQQFHPASGTFGTFLLARRKSRRHRQQPPVMNSRSNTRPASSRLLISSLYKHQRTSLNIPEQRFHSASGTFGTFPSTCRKSKRVEKGEKKKEKMAERKRYKKHKPTPVSVSREASGNDLPTSLQAIIARIDPDASVGCKAATDPARSEFEHGVDAVRSWEKRNLPSVERRGPSNIFINHTFSGPHITEPVAELSWTSHGKRKIGEAVVESEVEPPARPAKRGRVVKPIAAQARLKRPKPIKRFKTRRLTAAPGPSSGGSVLRNSDLPGVEGVLDPGIGGQIRKRCSRARIAARTMTDADVQKLVTAVTVIRTLTGGVDRHIDWVLIARLFPEHDQRFLNKSWGPIALKYKLQLEKLQVDFQETFLAVYESNAIPAIDYDDLEGYDWEWLIQWTLDNVDIPDSRNLPNLPAHREDLDELFEIKNDPEPSSHWRDDYYGVNVPLIKRIEIAAENSLSMPLTSRQNPARYDKDEELQIAKSWIRANVLTSEKVYHPKLAKQKLLQLGEDCLDRALDELSSERIVTHAHKGRTIPGRNYDITEHFLGCLRKPLDETHFAKAAAYKNRLDQAFQGPSGRLTLSYQAEDGEMLAVINLVANKYVELIPRNLQASRFGLMDGSYLTRFMDKSRLHFDLDIIPTASYPYGNPLLPLAAPPPQAHLVDDRLPIPVWYDIHGNFVGVMWKKVLAAVLATTSMRSGITLSELQRCTRPSLQAYELTWLMDWLVQVKAVRPVPNGWATDEWWWLILDAFL